MRVTNKAKRNICLILMIIGVLSCLDCILNIIIEEGSTNDWMKLSAILGFTLFAFAYFIVFMKRIKRGILYGDSTPTVNL